MRDGVQAAAGNLVRCPKCRRGISPGPFDCPYCGAPVALIWEDCRQACYFLRLAAGFLLASLIAGVITVLVTGSLGLTGLGIRNLAIISATIAVMAIVPWKLGDALNPPPEPYREIRDGRYRAGPRPPHGEGASSSGNANRSGLSAG